MNRTNLPVLHPLADRDHVLGRIAALSELHQRNAYGRPIIRAIMKGGRDAVEALFGSNTRLKDEHLPAANLIYSGASRLGQILGRPPTVKVPTPPNRDSDRARDHAQLVSHILRSYDERSELEMKLPRAGRWTPGYGYSLFVVNPRYDEWAEAWYPHVEIRHSYDVRPGFWGPDQDPDETAVVRHVDANWLSARYPEFESKHRNRLLARSTSVMSAYDSSEWEGQGDLIEVIEYMDRTGRYITVPDHELLLDIVPNVLSRPAFVLDRRFDFDDVIGQWDHAIGLMAMIAKLNIIGYVAAEDSTMSETNVIGDPTHAKYRRGRQAVNYFAPGTKIERGPMTSNLAQTFAQIDRIEQQFRTVANYSVMQDGRSPNSFATGQGIDRLAGAVDTNVEEYQRSLRRTLQVTDSLRLEMDERLYSGHKKPLEPFVAGNARTSFYNPASIDGRYRSQRAYGVMAGWDDGAKIINGLQLLGADALDLISFRENLHGADDAEQIGDRVAEQKAERGLYETLISLAQNGDVQAQRTLVEIVKHPSQRRTILADWIPDDEPVPEDPTMGLTGDLGGAPDDVQTILSRLDGSGSVKSGAQLVAKV